LSCIVYNFIAWRQEETNLDKTLIKVLIRSMWISPGVTEIAGDRKARNFSSGWKVRQAWASGNHAYEPFLFNLSALIAFGGPEHK
jgi:hypothetical protein